jgi:hypothetical protein
MPRAFMPSLPGITGSRHCHEKAQINKTKALNSHKTALPDWFGLFENLNFGIVSNFGFCASNFI